MFHSKKLLSKHTRQQNQMRIMKHISSNTHVCSKVLRRKVNLSKYIDSNIQRSDAFIRFASFFVGLDIVKKSKDYEVKYIDGFRCFEISGSAKNGELVKVHIREEIIEKDRILFLISTFYKTQK